MFKVLFIDRMKSKIHFSSLLKLRNSSLDLAVQILIVKKLGSQNEKKGVKSGNK
jgi:hypothetical protein